jgi:two-component system, OmpR family, sensor histidine kinase CiaH
MKLSPAARVAAVATAVIAVIYVICVVALNLVVSSHLTEQNDDSLIARLSVARHDPSLLSQRVAREGSSPTVDDDDLDADAAPIFLWSLNSAGSVTVHSPGAPVLPAGLLAAHPPRDGLGITANLGAMGPFRLKLARDAGGWLVAGQSLAGDQHTERLLLYGEVIAGPFLLLAMFLGSLVVGLRALAPVEQSRRRQLEFTADASHELRTPLSVIRAEADVALASPRQAAEYRDALTRIQGESQRLRQLVDDMLWLARFDSRPPPPRDEPVDLVTLAQACADRFRAVGPAITSDAGAEPALISAPPEWIDRLVGVLMDNACRYAGADGQVRIGVQAHGNRVSLIVEDSGPGIPQADRPQLFDRFHRATSSGAGRSVTHRWAGRA